MTKSKNKPFIVSLTILGLAFLVMFLILLLARVNPLIALTKMVTQVISSPLEMQLLKYYVAILILTGTSIAISMYTGMFNIGVEGQFIVGGGISVLTSHILNSAGVAYPIIALSAIIIGLLVGYLWGLLIGYLKIKFNVNEVVSGILLNYFGLALIAQLIKLEYFGKSYKLVDDINSSVKLPEQLSAIFRFEVLTIPVLLIIAMLVLVLYAFIKNKTKTGFSMQVMGKNEHAGPYIGIRTDLIRMNVLGLSGSIAALAGVLYFMYDGSVKAGSFAGFGFNGIAVASLGNLSAVGILLSATFLQFLQSSANASFGPLGLHGSLIGIVIGLIILLVSSQYAIDLIIDNTKNFFKEEPKNNESSNNQQIIETTRETVDTKIYGDLSETKQKLKAKPQILSNEEYQNSADLIPEEIDKKTSKSKIYTDIEDDVREVE